MKRIVCMIMFMAACFSASAQDIEKEIIDLMRADVDSVQTGLMEAVGLIEANKFADAMELLDSLSQKNPDDDALLYYLGICAYSTNSPAIAADYFGKASRLDPKNVWYKEALASSYVACGDGDKAGELYLELSDINPRKYRTAYTLTLIADAYRMKRNYEKYFEVLEEFAADERTDIEAKYKYLLSCITSFDRKTFDSLTPRMEKLCDAFIAAHPYSYDTHNLKMQLLAFQQKWGETIDEVTRMVKLTDDPEVISELYGIEGDAWYHMGSEKAAFSRYKLALKFNPENLSVLNNYAYFLSERKSNLKKAAAMSLVTVTREPDNATYLDTYGWILYLQGKYSEAKPYFKHAMIYGGKDSATILSHYAAVLEALGEKDLAKYYRSLAEKK